MDENKYMITIPYADFKLLKSGYKEDENFDENHRQLLGNLNYLDELVAEVANGEMAVKDAEDFALFKTYFGKIVLKNIGLFKTSPQKSTESEMK